MVDPCPIPTPPGYRPCWKGRAHRGLHDFRRLPEPPGTTWKPCCQTPLHERGHALTCLSAKAADRS